MLTLRLTTAFKAWLLGLRDMKGKLAITRRLQRFELGNPGDAKAVGEGVSELRIDVGPGYRVYFVRRGEVVVVILCGGDKGSQDRDIAKAKRLAAQLEDEE